MEKETAAIRQKNRRLPAGDRDRLERITNSAFPAGPGAGLRPCMAVTEVWLGGVVLAFNNIHYAGLPGVSRGCATAAQTAVACCHLCSEEDHGDKRGGGDAVLLASVGE